VFKRAVTFGRFNVPHLGHLALFNTLLVMGQEVVVMVSEGKGNLPIEVRLHLLRKLCPDPRVQFLPCKTPFRNSFIDEETVVCLGQDQENLGRALRKFFKCDTFLLRREESDPSSSRCRLAIANQDWSELVTLIPPSLIEDTLCLTLTGKHGS